MLNYNKDLKVSERFYMFEKVSIFNNTALVIATAVLLTCITSACGKKAPETPQKVSENPVNIASPKLADNLEYVLNKNYKLSDKQKIYITKSNSFQKAYFIGTLVDNNGNILPCIWFSNDENMDGEVYAANDYAIEASSMPDARTSNLKVTSSDDGYSRINQKILKDGVN